jgi:hypothetical protein
MRFVDCEQRKLRAREQVETARRQQPLRGDIEKIEVASEQALLNRGSFLPGERGV